MAKDNKDNVIPLRKKTGIDLANEHLANVRRNLADFAQHVEDTYGGGPHTGDDQVKGARDIEHNVPPPPAQSTIDEDLARREFYRKQNEMRKKREQNNRNVIRDYGLSKDDRGKGKPRK